MFAAQLKGQIMTVTVDHDMQRAFDQICKLQQQLLNGALSPSKIWKPLQDILEHTFSSDARLDRYSGMLVSPFDWLAQLHEYNAKYWGNRFSEDVFDEAEEQLAFLPHGHVQTISNIFGFHVEFGSLEETYEMWYKVYQGELPNAWRWPDLSVDAEHLSLHELARSYEPGIHLVNIDLVAHWEPEDGRSLIEVREQAKGTSEILAQLEVISIYGVLTQLFMEQDGKNLPYLDMPGTVVTVPDDSWPYALCVFWSPFDREASLHADWIGSRSSEWAAPVLKEVQI